jgi:SAM-dependent methyltransferase
MAQYYRVLAFNPKDAEAYGELGNALMDGGDFAGALKLIQRGIEIKESENLKLLFIQCVGNLNHVPAGVDLRQSLIRALSEPWGRPIYLAKFTSTLLKLNGATRTCINRVSRAWPRRLAGQEIFSPTDYAEICNDQLLRCFLTSTLVCDIELERFLTACRFALLEEARMGSQQIEESALCFFCALAEQCFINEYIFANTEYETEQAGRLRTLLVEALSLGTSITEILLVAVAAYFPLADLPVADLIFARLWSAPVAGLVAHQVRERQEERQLQASVPRLTRIEDGVSGLVKQQYEENPYPRWTKPALVGKPETIEAYLRSRFPLVPFRSVGKKRVVEVLVAGCGTGQYLIEMTRRFAGVQVLAVDLSLTSLSYAKRKTGELGLKNIECAQADILHLPSTGRVFDVIEASGVLHHLAAPLAGWRLLLSMLRPGGFMRLGLYSGTARQDVVDAHKFIAKRGYRPCADDIRRCRQEITSFDDGTSIRRVTECADFFSTSACRDLLFHVHEHQLTLPEIKAFLSEHGLQFLGFHVAGHVLQQFRRRFPEDTAAIDLNLWHTFETENPLVFIDMYQFWIQKPC